MKRQIEIGSRCLAVVPTQEVMFAKRAGRGWHVTPGYGACRLDRRWPRRRDVRVLEVEGTTMAQDGENHSSARGAVSLVVRLILQQLLHSFSVASPHMAEVMPRTTAEAPSCPRPQILCGSARAKVSEQSRRYDHAR